MDTTIDKTQTRVLTIEGLWPNGIVGGGSRFWQLEAKAGFAVFGLPTFKGTWAVTE